LGRVERDKKPREGGGRFEKKSTGTFREERLLEGNEKEMENRLSMRGPAVTGNASSA